MTNAANEWLETVTNRPAAYWMAACQQAVNKASSPSDDPKHDQTDVTAFISEVTRLVVASLPPEGSGEAPYDPNMRVAATLSLVLALWYGRLHYAKIHDPNRPASLRQRVYTRWWNWIHALFSAVLDEREDATFFPGQRWDFPFDPRAENGDFI